MEFKEYSTGKKYLDVNDIILDESIDYIIKIFTEIKNIYPNKDFYLIDMACYGDLCHLRIEEQ